MSARRTAATRSFQHVLIPRIVEMSEADNWERAKHEWAYTDYDHVKEYDGRACLCEYHPITHLHTITNRLNSLEAIIGSCCIKQFMGLADSELRSIAYVRGNPNKALNVSAIELAYSQGWINNWERNFCLDTQRKRNLSSRQQEKRKQINELVLARLAPVMLTEGELNAEKEMVRAGK
jgi:hypothetical protein